VILIIYFQYKIDEGLENLCNQFMAIFRTIGEALFFSMQNQSVGIILGDLKTRNSIDFDIEPYYSPISIDAYVDVSNLRVLLAKKNISVIRSKEVNNEIQKETIDCQRFPLRQMLPSECRDTGVFLAKSFPFARNVVKLASCIIGLMSFFPRWKAVHLRIEGELVLNDAIRNMGLETYTMDQLQKTMDSISITPNLSAVYIASGIQEEKYNNVIKIISEKFPDLTMTRHKDVLMDYPELKNEFESLSLEEQALVDWLVCIGAPFFAGPHGSSYSYLIGYMRHYREFDTETTHLYPDYQPCWDAWFPRV